MCEIIKESIRCRNEQDIRPRRKCVGEITTLVLIKQTTTVCRMNPTHSSQDFVRSLKLASDPPLVGGPYKIEIAQEAWEDASFYVPNKAEIIADWILAKFLKDKGKEMYGFSFVLFFLCHPSYLNHML